MSKPAKKYLDALDAAATEGIDDIPTLRRRLVGLFGIGQGEVKSIIAYWLSHDAVDASTHDDKTDRNDWLSLDAIDSTDDTTDVPTY